MASTYDLFKRLTSGVKFNKKKFKDDFEKLKPSQNSRTARESTGTATALDFFGNLSSDLQLERECQETKDLRSGKAANPAKELASEKVVRMKEVRKKKQRRGKVRGESNGGKAHIQDAGLHIFTSRQDNSRERVLHTTTSDSENQAGKHMEKMNALRHEQHIYTKGSDIPDPAEEFSHLQERYDFPSYIIENVKKRGYQSPTPIQMQAIPLMVHKREVLCCAPTGSGKTAAFILPILHHLKSPKKLGFRAVVVSPTRELAQQIYAEFCHLSRGCSFRIHVLTKAKASSNSFGVKATQRFDILVTTPNRLVHLLNEEPPGVELHNVEWLVLDEADKLFEEGKAGFRDQVAAIYQACDMPGVRRALFSATLSNGIEDWARAHLDNVVRVTVGVRNTATETVEQELLFVGQESGKLLAVRDIVQKGFKPPMLIFVQSKERAKELFHELIYDGINVDVIHSDRTQAQRDNVVKCFRTGKIWVLIATELMGRGIDFKGVNLVLNYDFPASAVSYIHRIGRTGRAGRSGKAITFFTEDDSINLRSIANVMKSSGCDVPEWMLKVKGPDRRTKKKLTKAPVERSTIRTASKYDLVNAKRKRAMIESSKRKKKARTEP